VQIQRTQNIFFPKDEMVEKDHLQGLEKEFFFEFLNFFNYFLKIKHQSVYFLSLFHHAFLVHNF